MDRGISTSERRQDLLSPTPPSQDMLIFAVTTPGVGTRASPPSSEKGWRGLVRRPLRQDGHPLLFPRSCIQRVKGPREKSLGRRAKASKSPWRRLDGAASASRAQSLGIAQGRSTCGGVRQGARHFRKPIGFQHLSPKIAIWPPSCARRGLLVYSAAERRTTTSLTPWRRPWPSSIPPKSASR